MITINLLPHELRHKEKKFVLPYKGVYVFVAAAIVLLLHLLLFLTAIVKEVQVSGLKKKVGVLEPQTKDAAAMRKEIKSLESELDGTKSVLLRKASITEVLSGLNLSVPKSLWLEHFSFSATGFMIQGSVVSLNQSEMTIIGKFLQNLKINKTFYSIFSKIELGSVQRRTIKTYDVVDFIISGEFKK